MWALSTLSLKWLISVQSLTRFCSLKSSELHKKQSRYGFSFISETVGGDVGKPCISRQVNECWCHIVNGAFILSAPPSWMGLFLFYLFISAVCRLSVLLKPMFYSALQIDRNDTTERTKKKSIPVVHEQRGMYKHSYHKKCLVLLWMAGHGLVTCKKESLCGDESFSCCWRT